VKLTANDVNELFRTAVGYGLKPTEFALRRDTNWSGIYHEQSGSHFLMKPHVLTFVKFRVDPFFTFRRLHSYDVSAKVRDEKETLYQAIQWDNIRLLVPDWAKRVNRQGVWAEAEQVKDAFTATQGKDAGNAQFTEDEQRQIAVQFQEVKRYLKEEFDLSGEQISEVEEKLDEIVEAGKRMGRKDWLVYLLGTITALVISATVAAPVGEHIFTMIIHGLGHLFTGGNEPPRITRPPIT
jgi:hypothetical protein